MSPDSECHSRPTDDSAGQAHASLTATPSDRDRSLSLETPISPRKRDTLQFLLDTDGPVTIRAVTDHVAAAEHETAPTALSADQRQPVYVALYQSLLPELDDKDIVEYDKARGTVRLTADRAAVESTLEFTESEPEPTSGGTAEQTGTVTTEKPAVNAGDESSNIIAERAVSLFGIASLGVFASPALTASSTVIATVVLALAVVSQLA
ncbi:DUF7344 domain-containing protein [Natrialba aegyptia]|uniref:DUF7344 domain-containing protein n=1 Tax=Natrialba aegyptia DSM 13077 TaxID=1227491 RepID=M0BAA1_9EURY|nr:hypothetical protein [Natrialba aegyptia]ELZ07407.1 hypothetical protein C480_05106 [Natrialba aegyptia DSM 13077]